MKKVYKNLCFTMMKQKDTSKLSMEYKKAVLKLDQMLIKKPNNFLKQLIVQKIISFIVTLNSKILNTLSSMITGKTIRSFVLTRNMKRLCCKEVKLHSSKKLLVFKYISAMMQVFQKTRRKNVINQKTSTSFCRKLLLKHGVIITKLILRYMGVHQFIGITT